MNLPYLATPLGSSVTVSSQRRWFQFSLRTLLILVTLAVGLLVAWRAYVDSYRRQLETMELIEELGGKYGTEAADKWLRWIYGDDFQNLVFVDVADCDNPEAYLDRVAALPCLETLVVGSHKFSDQHVARLEGLDTLRGLVLDSTNVTDAAIASLRSALPDLAVRKSQRRAIICAGHAATERCKSQARLRRLVGYNVDQLHFEDAVFLWQQFSKEALESHLADGKTVLVVFYAHWKPRPVWRIDKPSVRHVIRTRRVVPMVINAHYALFDVVEIGESLSAIHKVPSSMPLAVIYRPGRNPVVFTDFTSDEIAARIEAELVR